MRIVSALSAIVVSSAAFAGIFPEAALWPSGSGLAMTAGAMTPTVIRVLDQPVLRDHAQTATTDAVAAIRESLIEFVNGLKLSQGIAPSQVTNHVRAAAMARDPEGGASRLMPKLGNVHIIVRPAPPMTEAERARARGERSMFERLKAQENDFDEADLALEYAVQQMRNDTGQ